MFGRYNGSGEVRKLVSSLPEEVGEIFLAPVGCCGMFKRKMHEGRRNGKGRRAAETKRGGGHLKPPRLQGGEAVVGRCLPFVR